MVDETQATQLQKEFGKTSWVEVIYGAVLKVSVHHQ